MLRRALVAVGLIAWGAAAQAATTVIDVTGPSPFGFANQKVMVEGWTQNISFTNVTVTAPLEDNSSGGPIGGVEGTVYLVNAIGPGATAANNVAPPVSISGLTAAFAPRVLFSGLSLPPGQYFIVWVPTNTNPLSMSPEGASLPVVTTGAFVGQLGADASLTPAPFPPATPVTLQAPGNFFLTVTGDAGPPPIPAMSTWALALLGAALLMIGLKFATR